MLNVFPELLTYSLFAPMILRLVTGFIFLAAGALLVGKQKAMRISQFETASIRPGNVWVLLLGTVQFVGAGLLILGLWTQIGALILLAVTLFALFVKSKNPETFREPKIYFVLLLAVLVSLLFSGAGFIAFDLPL